MNSGPGVSLTVTLVADGSIRLEGPLADKVFCLGLLEMAKQSVLHFKPSASGIVKPESLKVLS